MYRPGKTETLAVQTSSPGRFAHSFALAVRLRVNCATGRSEVTCRTFTAMLLVATETYRGRAAFEDRGTSILTRRARRAFESGAFSDEPGAISAGSVPAVRAHPATAK